MDIEISRINMIKQQVKTWEVLDQKILDLIGQIHREDFVPPEFGTLALADTAIPIGHEQVTMTPKLEARLLQSLDIQSSDRVLEIGTGCAYLTALLARLAGSVVSVDLYHDFTQAAVKKLARYSIVNVALQTRDVFLDWHIEEAFDVIVVTGSVPVLDKLSELKLAPGGRMFAIVGTSLVMEALLLRHSLVDQHCAVESLFETELTPLIGANSPKKAFVF